MQTPVLTKPVPKARVLQPALHQSLLESMPTLSLHEDFPTLDTARDAITRARSVISRLEERIRQLENMALTDELTGLLNRRGLALALQRELSLARRDTNAQGVLVMVDLDGFKSVNDLWGHGVGDDYLQAVAHALLGSVRETDVVARLGGDEFVILFTRMSQSVGLKRMARLEKDFHARGMLWGEKTLPLRASFGLSAYDGNDTPEVILASADRKLYASKAARHAGRG